MCSIKKEMESTRPAANPALLRNGSYSIHCQSIL